MATADALLAWARTQLGVTENPPASNRVRYWDDIGQSGNQGQPWCAAFYLAGLMRVGVGPVTRSVYVPEIRSIYQHAGRLKPIEQAQPGDQVFFSFGDHAAKTHTGIVVAVDAKARTVESIDGNTSPALGGVEWNGGGVYHRIRPWSQTWGVGHPAFDPVAEVKPMFVPPVTLRPLVAEWFPPSGGHYQLGDDGSVYAWGGAPYLGGPNGQPYFAGRKPARIEAPNVEETAAGRTYVVIATSGERYAY